MQQQPSIGGPFRSLERAALVPAPRSVPGGLELRLLLGNPWAQGGFLMLAFGAIFLWVFLPRTDFSSLTVSGPVDRVQGEIVRVKPTSMEENSRRIHAVDFRADTDGRVVLGTSYAKGPLPEIGDTVAVEVPRGQPELARIAGMRRRPFAIWLAAIVLVLPLGALVAVGVGLALGRRRIRVLAHGQPGLGRLVHREETRMTVNDKAVWKLSFDFTDHGGRTRRVVLRTTKVDRLSDDAEEPLVYDPADPERAVLLDIMPGGPKLDARGQLAYDMSPWGLLAAVGPPFLAIVANVVAAAFVLI